MSQDEENKVIDINHKEITTEAHSTVAKKRFVTGDRALLMNPEVSTNARCLYIYLLNQPSDWVFHDSEMRKHLQNCGTRSLENAFTELRSLGYVTNKLMRDKSGKVTGSKRIYAYENIFLEENKKKEQLKLVNKQNKEIPITEPSKSEGSVETDLTEALKYSVSVKPTESGDLTEPSLFRDSKKCRAINNIDLVNEIEKTTTTELVPSTPALVVVFFDNEKLAEALIKKYSLDKVLEKMELCNKTEGVDNPIGWTIEALLHDYRINTPKPKLDLGQLQEAATAPILEAFESRVARKSKDPRSVKEILASYQEAQNNGA